MSSIEAAPIQDEVEDARNHPRGLLGAATLAATLAVLWFASAAGAHDEASHAAAPAEPGRAVAEYRALTTRICISAHRRLNDVLGAAGVELTPAGHRGLARVPTTKDGFVAYDRAARRIMAKTLPRLRAISPPRPVRPHFSRLYGLMEQYAKGVQDPFAFWIHQVEQERSLYHCTFSLGR